MNSYRPQIYNQAQGQFQRSPAGSFIETDGIVQPAIAQTLTASTAIAPVASIVAISSASAIALTSTPTIADGAAGKFQQLILTNAGNNDITLQDSATLANSGLRLFKNNWTIKPGRSLTVIYRGDDWQQLFDGETLSDSDILAAILRTDADNAGINASTLQGLARSGFLQAGNNLSDLTSRTTARSNIEASSPFWNAAKIMGVDVSPVAPTQGQSLIFNASTNQYAPSTPSSSYSSSSLNEILYRDSNWGLYNQSSERYAWRSYVPEFFGNPASGESATGAIEFGYLTLSNFLLLILSGGGNTNGHLKRIKILRAVDNAVLIDTTLNALMPQDTSGIRPAILNTTSFAGTRIKIRLEDNDTGFGWAWLGIYLPGCCVVV